MTPINKEGNNKFDLEQAIARWKRSLRSLQAIQDGDLIELEGYLRDKIEELVELSLSAEEAFQKAASEFSGLDDLDSDYYRARSVSRFRGRPPWKPPRFLPALLWNYYKIVGRKLKRQKAYSFITIAGLTVGMTAFILIILYCRAERSYDGFHRNSDRIYRVQNDRINSAKHDRSAGCPPGLGPAMIEEFPEIEDSARLLNVSGNFNIVSRMTGASGDEESRTASRAVSFYEKRVFFADPSFLRFFSFPLLRGDAGTALEGLDAVVLTETTARKYFGDEDPLQQILSVTTRFGPHDYRVAGVCADIPPNSHLRFDLLLSFRSLAVIWPSIENQTWSSNAFLTYILLSPVADPRSLESKFPLLVEKYSLESADFKREFHLQSLRNIHLTSQLRFEADINGDIKTVRFLEIIGLFILLIAWVNSINLSTARSLQRGKEVCVRKTLGAERRQLTGQFLFESVFLNTLAFLLAVGVVHTILPFFSRLVGKSLSPGQLATGWVWMSLSIIAGAILSGLYPAFILSSFRPVSALSGIIRDASKGKALRKGLVLVQFALAILLIAATLTVGKQLAFIGSQDLGANIDQTLVLKIPPVDEPEQQALLARDQMVGLAPIAAATVSTSVPGREYSNSAGGIRRQNASQDEAQALFFIDVDDCYFQFFRIPLLGGRAFSQGFLSDGTAVILNEEAVSLLGFESADKALLQNILVFGDSLQVVGVVRDYHHKSLRNKIEPVMFWPLPYSKFPGTNYLSLKIQDSSTERALAAVENKWKELFPGQPFEYAFLDEEFDGQYDTDKRFSRIFGLASLLAVFISCLGLFGLASFSAEQRKREIGIRKVFGATIPEITAMLAGEFVRWVVLANLIAWPVTWIVMSKWLQRFAYRTKVGLWTLGLAGLVALVIALATVSFKAIRSASANPVDSIRYE